MSFDTTEALTSDNTHKILITEDNLELRNFLVDSFLGSYQIVEAKDGVEGLKMVEEELPDIIISDVMMPGMDGFEFCKILKSNVDTSHIPIILLTAKTPTKAG